jgi:hypothetical protein
MKIPLKTKVFAWYFRRAVILTKDNLVKRYWHGCKKYVFCHQDETIKHLFSTVGLLDLYGQSFRWVLPYTRLIALQIYLAIG